MAFYQLNREVNSPKLHEANCLVPWDIFFFNSIGTVQNETRHALSLQKFCGNPALQP